MFNHYSFCLILGNAPKNELFLKNQKGSPLEKEGRTFLSTFCWGPPHLDKPDQYFFGSCFWLSSSRNTSKKQNKYGNVVYPHPPLGVLSQQDFCFLTFSFCLHSYFYFYCLTSSFSSFCNYHRYEILWSKYIISKNCAKMCLQISEKILAQHIRK